MSDLSATFWGVRGGYPVPGESTVGYGGNTTCLEVRAGPHLIIVDAGTGIIALGNKLAAERAQSHQPIVATMLFSHGHHDHTQGLPFFEPLHFRDTVLDVFGPRVFDDDLEDTLRRTVMPPMFPVARRTWPGIRSIQNIQGEQVVLIAKRGEPPIVVEAEDRRAVSSPEAVKAWIYHSSSHPTGGTFCYRFEYHGKRLVFATDTEGYVGGDTLLSRFVHGVDVLIHDAEYTEQEYTGPPSRRQGWGHSTWNMAVSMGKRANVKQLVLTHHNAKHDDAYMREIESTAQSVFPQTVVAREGMTIEL